MDNNEIGNDAPQGKRGKIEGKFEGLVKGQTKRVPNMTHLPPEKKEELAKAALAHAADMLMSVYVSLGITGEAVIGLKDARSGIKFILNFKTE